MIAIRFPFTFDSTYGLVVQTTDDNTIYTDRVRTLLSTAVLQKPMQPDYGVDIHRSLYESGHDHELAIRDAIITGIYTHLPEVKIFSMDVVTAGIDGTVSIKLDLEYPTGKVDTTIVSNAFLLADGTVAGNIL